jgi:CRP-like cAMP-binding protein
MAPSPDHSDHSAPSPDYPLHRPELYEALRHGDRLLAHAMAPDERSVRAGERIVQTEEDCPFVFRLRAGWLCRSRGLGDGRRQIITIFLPGDLCAVKALLFAEQPDAIEALTDVTMNAIAQDRLRLLAAEEPDVALRLMLQLAEDERRLHSWVIGLGRGTADEKMAAMLLDFRGRLRRIGLCPDDSFRVPLTQHQMGDYLGITVVHVNRVLRRFREAGLVTIRSNVVTLHAPERLAALARPVQDPFERAMADFAAE